MEKKGLILEKPVKKMGRKKKQEEKRSLISKKELNKHRSLRKKQQKVVKLQNQKNLTNRE